jgi:hypothetical protein
VRNGFAANQQFLARFRVACDARLSKLDLKAAETPNLDPITSTQRFRHSIDQTLHCLLD